MLAHGWLTIPEVGVVWSIEPFKFLEWLQVELSRRSSQVLSTYVDGQFDKLVMVVGHQFITLTVYICVQHDGREAPRRVGLSAAA